MRKSTLKSAFAALLVTATILTYGQGAPGKFNYQAVIRDANGAGVINQNVDIRFELYDAAAGGNLVYQEDFANKGTGSFGVVNLQVGGGTNNASGNLPLKGLNWGVVNYYVNIRMAPGGTGNYTDISSNRTQLVSAPYAMFAAKSDTANAVKGGGIPAGTIVAYGGATPPTGWLACDGASYSTTGQYTNLYAAINFNFGGSGGNFNVPDLRGMFLRGWNSSRSDTLSDPDRASRTAMATGGQSGNNIGSVEQDALQDHRHAMGTDGSSNGGYSVNHTGNQSGGSGFSNNTTSEPISVNNGGAAIRISTETRPKNVYVNYIIKW